MNGAVASSPSNYFGGFTAAKVQSRGSNGLGAGEAGKRMSESISHACVADENDTQPVATTGTTRRNGGIWGVWEPVLACDEGEERGLSAALRHRTTLGRRGGAFRVGPALI